MRCVALVAALQATGCLVTPIVRDRIAPEHPVPLDAIIGCRVDARDGWLDVALLAVHRGRLYRYRSRRPLDGTRTAEIPPAEAGPGPAMPRGSHACVAVDGEQLAPAQPARHVGADGRFEPSRRPLADDDLARAAVLVSIPVGGWLRARLFVPPPRGRAGAPLLARDEAYDYYLGGPTGRDAGRLFAFALIAPFMVATDIVIAPFVGIALLATKN